MDSGPLHRIDMRYIRWQGFNEDPRDAVNRHKQELGAVFVEGWKKFCEDWTWNHSSTPGRTPLHNAREFEGGRDFAAQFLDIVSRRHDGDVALAAQSRGIWVDWQGVRGRFPWSQ